MDIEAPLKPIPWDEKPDGATHVGWISFDGGYWRWYCQPEGSVNYDYYHAGCWYGGWGRGPTGSHITEVKNMKPMKFRVRDEQHSAQIQQALFNLGYRWGGEGKGDVIQFTSQPFLFLHGDGKIRYAQRETYFTDLSWPEMDVVPNTTYEFVQIIQPETVELNGKTYLKSDLEEALKKLIPVVKEME